MRQIILDTETTGLLVDQGHRIIEIGCVELINRKITGKHYHQYINPERAVEEGALAIHGLSNEFLENKPVFSDVIEEFMTFINGDELVIHNAPFDVGFLNAELKLLKHAQQSINDVCQVTDTLALARQLHIGQRNSLDALCKRYNVDNSHREYHGALLDAHLLARVYLAMTGGQATLFGQTETIESTIQQTTKTKTVSKKTHDLLVIKASDEELIEHEKRLKQMAEQGKCLWK